MSILCTSLLAVPFSVHSDGSAEDFYIGSETVLPSSSDSGFLPAEEPAPSHLSLSEQPSIEKVHIKTDVKPFTGKVKKNKVRLRLQPGTDSSIVQELGKDTLLLVTGETEDFWAVVPPADCKSYVFRSFVLDGKIEGNRVNVRLAPNTESAVIAHLNSGDPVTGTICASSPKWLEISPPETVRFYVAKNLIEDIGGPEIKVAKETKAIRAKQEFASVVAFVEAETEKYFPSIDLDKINHTVQTFAQEYAEFPELTEQASELLVKTQEKFLEKRIAYIDSKSYEEANSGAELVSEAEVPVTDKMKSWIAAEEELYQGWIGVNEGRDLREYYDDQKLTAVKLTGMIEPYLAPVKCKPGDYFLKQNGMPIAYVYSTKINLQDLVGKQVTCIASPRPNNNFAFPAYFIMEVEN